MKTRLLITLIATIFFLKPCLNFGQAPDLGTTYNFAVFTAAGAFDVLGANTVVTGDVGTDVGQFTGFPPGTLIGQIHNADPVSAQAKIDVLSAYGAFAGITCGITLTGTLGNGTILTPNVYCKGDATTLNGDLILDAQGDPNAIFIFKIGGAFATSTHANIIMANSGNLCNVYWQINGAFTLGDSSVFRGNIIANGAIHLLEGSSLHGRALSVAGAVDLHNNVVTREFPAVASIIWADGPVSFCVGDSVILSGNDGGVWSTGATTPTITVKSNGNYFVTNTTECCTFISNHIIVTVVECGQGTLIPVSNWALLLAGLLIVLFVFLRYRRNI